MPQYSNTKALGALIKASLQSIAKSPSAIFFSFAFPVIFILIFGFIGGTRTYSIPVVLAKGSDTNNTIYMALKHIPTLKWVKEADTVKLNKSVAEGDVTAIILINKQPEGTFPLYKVSLNGAASERNKIEQLRGMILEVIQNQDPEIQKRISEDASVSTRIFTVREFSMIDFILPGQIGFSLLSGSIFGTAFVFFNLRNTLVLKRFFATPVRREIIVLSEGIARMFFQLMSAIIIIVMGYYFFHFTLIHGFITFLMMISMCLLAIMVFMAIGFIISGIVKNDTSIPMISNLFILPQMLISGTFFPIDGFPKWLHGLSQVMPLTHLNTALRKIAFDGASYWDIRVDILVLLAWGIVLYITAGRVFKWE